MGEEAMRKRSAWRLGAALLFGLGSVIAGPTDARAGNETGSASTKSGDWFGRSARPADNEPSTRRERVDPDKPSSSQPPTVIQEAASLRSREEAKYLRRLQVCDRLRDIADQTNDTTLARRADELMARAEELYRKRTANLPSAQPLFESDKKTLDKHLGPTPATGRPSSAPALFNVSTRDDRATAKEEK
jgi:hypothetical protein